jgi:hypothetical protein
MDLLRLLKVKLCVRHGLDGHLNSIGYALFEIVERLKVDDPFSQSADETDFKK